MDPATAEQIWTTVDAYFETHLVGPDDALDAALAASVAAGLPAINVTPTQGKFLHLLAELCGARRILEIGTLGGYSTIWLARALPRRGRLISLEIDANYAAVALENLARAGVADRVEIRVAPAVESLAALAAQHAEPFDFVFIDADKANSDIYCRAALQLARVGTVIVVDNVVRDGAVIDESAGDDGVRGVRRLVEFLDGHAGATATALQTVGNKGYDGFLLAVVREPGTADRPARRGQSGEATRNRRG
jgi:predicted O-methyltransferase YrrM